MIRWSLDAGNDCGTLMIDGDMTIQHISDLKGHLVEAFESAKRVTVDVSAATSVDVAGVQLLYACHRYSTGRGKQMCLRLGNNDAFAQFLDEVGFAQDFICDHGHANQCL